jgi:hypothetical protein
MYYLLVHVPFEKEEKHLTAFVLVIHARDGDRVITHCTNSERDIVMIRFRIRNCQVQS